MALPELPLIEQIPLIHKYGFDAIDIRMRENDSGEVPPDALPEEYQRIAQQEDIDRAVCDYISGMSDGYAVDLYTELFIPKGWRSSAGPIS